MNKTFIAAIAMATAAGFVFAAIETPAAGYAESDASGTQWVCNPFNSFTGNATTLGDIDGSQLDSTETISVFSNTGKKLFEAVYDTDGWYVGGECSNSYPLARGESIQFTSTGHSLVMAGTIGNAPSPVTLTEGYNFVGNAFAVDKSLSDFQAPGFDSNKDYVQLDGVKYVYKNSKWYLRDTSTEANVSVPAGKGLLLFCQKRVRGSLNASFGPKN